MELKHVVALGHALAEAVLPCRALPAENAFRPGV
jgi:hypothetical protein